MRMWQRLLGGLIACATLSPAPAASPAWREATSDHFVIAGQLEEAPLRDYATKLERFDAALRVLSGVGADAETSNKLAIILVPTMFDVGRARGTPGSDIGGYYQPRAAGSIAVAPLRVNGIADSLAFTPTVILLHEYSHHFFFRTFSGVFPRWFIEGYAEAVSAVRFEADGAVSIGLDDPIRRATLSTEHNGSVTRLFQPDNANMMWNGAFYARAWQLSHFLLFHPQWQPQFRRYLSLLMRGEPGDKAAAAAFGNVRRLQEETRTHYADGQITGQRIAAGRIHESPVTVRTLGPGEAAIAIVHLRSRSGVTTRAAPGVLAEVQAAAAPFPNDPRVQEAVAEAALDAHAFDIADAAADRAIKADPKATPALLIKAQTIRQRAIADGKAPAWAEVRRWLVAANRSDPNAALPMLLYYRSFLAEGVVPSLAAVRGLQRAAVISPESLGTRITLAAHELHEGRVDDARTLLAPVAYAPHGGVWTAAALAAIRQLGTAKPADIAQPLDAAISKAEWNAGD